MALSRIDDTIESRDANIFAIFEKLEDDKKVVNDCKKLIKKYFDKSYSKRDKDKKLQVTIDNAVGDEYVIVAEVPDSEEGRSSQKFFIKFERSTDVLDWLNDNCKRYKSLLSKGDSLVAALKQLDFETYGY